MSTTEEPHRINKGNGEGTELLGQPRDQCAGSGGFVRCGGRERLAANPDFHGCFKETLGRCR